MLEIDGSHKSGSGTILRLSLALSGIIGEPLHIYNIRQKRGQPGLRPQHLESVKTAAKLCNAETVGAELGSRELWFKPDGIISGEVRAEIGTAGSISMLLLTILPLCIHAKGDIRVHVINGGTDVRYAPTINYLKYVFLPLLGRMGLKASLTVKKYGYYPKGMGEVVFDICSVSKLSSISLDDLGMVKEVGGISVCTLLDDRRVAERQAKTAKKILWDSGYTSNILIVNDLSNTLQRGSSLVLWVKTNKGAILGGDAIGELRKSAEAVGRDAAISLLREVKAGATADVHLADMLVPYVALANGTSRYLTREVTEHLDTNIWLVEKVLGVKFSVSRVGELFRVEKS